jgi:hypothetical protein
VTARPPQGRRREPSPKDPARPQSYRLGESVPLDHLRWLWGETEQEPPALSSAACLSISVALDNVRLGFPRPQNRQSPPRPGAKELDVLLQCVESAEARWRGELEDRGGGAAKEALLRLADLRRALDRMPRDWLLGPEVHVQFVGWQSAALFIYPVVVSACLASGRVVSKPHAKDSLCKFLHAVLELIDQPSTSGAGVAKFLRAQLGYARNCRPPADPAKSVAAVERKGLPPQMMWQELLY